VSATFVICVHDFPCGEVLVKVSIMEFALYGDIVLLLCCCCCDDDDNDSYDSGSNNDDN